MIDPRTPEQQAWDHYDAVKKVNPIAAAQYAHDTNLHATPRPPKEKK